MIRELQLARELQVEVDKMSVDGLTVVHCDGVVFRR